MTARRGRAGACSGAAGGGGGETEIGCATTAWRVIFGCGFGLGTRVSAGGGGAWTTEGRAGSGTERSSGDVGSGVLTRIGTVTRVPTARASTTPLVMETSFGLMEIPLTTDTLP